MKKTFLARRNALLSPSGLTAGTVVLLVVLACGAVRFVAPNVFLTVFAPVLRTGNALALRTESFVSGFQNAQMLAAANERLTSENAALSLQNRMLTEQVSDFSALAGPGDLPSAGVVAGVLARPPESPYDTLIISRGTNGGVTLGMEAFGAGGTPLGIVTETSASFARVTLFSTSGRHSSGWVGKNRVPVTLVGQGAGAFTATIPKAANTSVGDGVFLPGPGALLIGTVTALESDPSSPAVTLLIHPALNPFSIPWVTLADTGAAFVQTLTASSTKP
ncbi:MAG TPA: rod shape-determining protein MreC [Candidatus Paceibacterota bacterium]|nr:rod shape-determining protein MreC [Candidatus Paceibacterota bacterium]